MGRRNYLVLDDGIFHPRPEISHSIGTSNFPLVNARISQSVPPRNISIHEDIDFPLSDGRMIESQTSELSSPKQENIPLQNNSLYFNSHHMEFSEQENLQSRDNVNFHVESDKETSTLHQSKFPLRDDGKLQSDNDSHLDSVLNLPENLVRIVGNPMRNMATTSEAAKMPHLLKDFSCIIRAHKQHTVNVPMTLEATEMLIEQRPGQGIVGNQQEEMTSAVLLTNQTKEKDPAVLTCVPQIALPPIKLDHDCGCGGSSKDVERCYCFSHSSHSSQLHSLTLTSEECLSNNNGRGARSIVRNGVSGECLSCTDRDHVDTDICSRCNDDVSQKCLPQKYRPCSLNLCKPNNFTDINEGTLQDQTVSTTDMNTKPSNTQSTVSNNVLQESNTDTDTFLSNKTLQGHNSSNNSFLHTIISDSICVSQKCMPNHTLQEHEALAISSSKTRPALLSTTCVSQKCLANDIAVSNKSSSAAHITIAGCSASETRTETRTNRAMTAAAHSGCSLPNNLESAFNLTSSHLLPHSDLAVLLNTVTLNSAETENLASFQTSTQTQNAHSTPDFTQRLNLTPTHEKRSSWIFRRSDIETELDDEKVSSIFSEYLATLGKKVEENEDKERDVCERKCSLLRNDTDKTVLSVDVENQQTENLQVRNKNIISGLGTLDCICEDSKHREEVHSLQNYHTNITLDVENQQLENHCTEYQQQIRQAGPIDLNSEFQSSGSDLTHSGAIEFKANSFEGTNCESFTPCSTFGGEGNAVDDHDFEGGENQSSASYTDPKSEEGENSPSFTSGGGDIESSTSYKESGGGELDSSISYSESSAMKLLYSSADTGIMSPCEILGDIDREMCRNCGEELDRLRNEKSPELDKLLQADYRETEPNNILFHSGENSESFSCGRTSAASDRSVSLMESSRTDSDSDSSKGGVDIYINELSYDSDHDYENVEELNQNLTSQCLQSSSHVNQILSESVKSPSQVKQVELNDVNQNKNSAVEDKPKIDQADDNQQSVSLTAPASFPSTRNCCLLQKNSEKYRSTSLLNKLYNEALPQKTFTCPCISMLNIDADGKNVTLRRRTPPVKRQQKPRPSSCSFLTSESVEKELRIGQKRFSLYNFDKVLPEFWDRENLNSGGLSRTNSCSVSKHWDKREEEQTTLFTQEKCEYTFFSVLFHFSKEYCSCIVTKNTVAV